MKCSFCGGAVAWIGNLIDNPSTQCAGCGRRNCQEVEARPFDDDWAPNPNDDQGQPLGVPPSDDAQRLDYLQRTGSTVELVPNVSVFAPLRFRIGGLHTAVSIDLRVAIDLARGADGVGIPQGGQQ